MEGAGVDHLERFGALSSYWQEASLHANTRNELRLGVERLHQLWKLLICELRVVFGDGGRLPFPGGVDRREGGRLVGVEEGDGARVVRLRRAPECIKSGVA